MRIDLQAAEKYLAILDESAESFTWQTFDDAAKGRSNLIRIMHGSLDQLSEQLVKLNEAGAGVYVTVNETDGKGRKIENITRIRAVFADLDGAPLEGVQACSLEPHIIVESSTGKFHAYWLTDGIGLDEFSDIQSVIADRFESDPAVKDLPRILRVPGFIHRKGDPVPVRIIHESGGLPYAADVIRREFPPGNAKRLSGYTGAAPETEARGFQAHLKQIGHHKDGGGFHWPLTRAIAAYIAQYGADTPVAPLKMIIRAAIDGADRSRYNDAQLANVKSDIYLDRAIHGAIAKFGASAPKAATVAEVAQTVETANGGKVVHLRERQQGAAPEPEQAAHPLEWQDDLKRSARGTLYSSIANITKILTNDDAWRGVLGFDLFSQKIMKLVLPPFDKSKLGEWEDRDDHKLSIWLSDHYEMNAKPADVIAAVGVSAELSNSFHPVRQYLRGLSWDGTARLDSWLTEYMGAEDSEYHAAVGKNWMIGAVARVAKPGCKMDNVIIFEGGQGRGKSTALSILGQQWFTDTPFEIGSKDSYVALRGKWIIELSELDSFNRAESTKLKHFFAASVDTYREHYGKRTADVPRQCVFAGTTNADEYLRDDSGNRRYWPVKTGEIDQDKLRRDCHQLWAEAAHRYKQGEKWWFESNDEAIEQEQGKRYLADVWETRVAVFIDVKKKQRMPGSSIPFHMPIGTVLEECLEIPAGKWTRPDQMRVASVLKRLGFIRKQVLIEGKRIWSYQPKFNE